MVPKVPNPDDALNAKQSAVAFRLRSPALIAAYLFVFCLVVPVIFSDFPGLSVNILEVL